MHTTETERTPRAAAGHHPVIAGVGAYRPRRIVTNEEICHTLDSSPEWIVRRSGINTRCFAGPDETLVEMGTTAAGKALADAGLAPTDVDLLLVATMSDVHDPDRLVGDVARRLGVNAPGSLVAGACAGFTIGLAAAAKAISAGMATNALVVGVERMSDILDPTDRSTAFIFSDGAGAAVVGRDTETGIGPVVWGTDTSLREAITVRPEAAHEDRPIIRMTGSPVFRWAVTNLPDIARAAIDRAGLTPQDIQAFVPHQANLRITESVTDSLGFGDRVVVARDIVDQGNSSAASIPLALDRLRTSGALRSGDLTLLMGFGAGLTHAALVVRMP